MSKRTIGKEPPVRLGLYVTEERDKSWKDFYHVRATVVVIGLTAYEMRRIDAGEDLGGECVDYQRIRNADDTPVRGLFLNNLTVTSQGCGEDEPRHLYGWEVCYRGVGEVDLHTAERMAKTLKAIDGRMERITAKYGRPATFGQYLARVAEAIGATAIVRPDEHTTPVKRGAWGYDGQGQRVRDIRDGIDGVDGLVRAWMNERELERRRTEEAQARAEAERVAQRLAEQERTATSE